MLQNASSPADIESAYANFVQQQRARRHLRRRSLSSTRGAISSSSLALGAQLPTMYFFRDFAAAGGLMCYGGYNTDVYRLAGGYVARVLKGEKPEDLPVQQSTKFDLVVNLKTAKALGLEIPLSLIGRADEVIE